MKEIINNEYTGGREMMVTDLWDLTERDRAIIRLRELREAKFKRESMQDFKTGSKKALWDMAAGILCLVVSFLIVLAAIMFKNAGI